jgi:hypothetical protein
LPLIFSSGASAGVSLANNGVTVAEAGVYMINYAVYLNGTASVGVNRNGALVPGSLVNDSAFLAGSVTASLNANQAVTLVNQGTLPIALQAPSGGSSNVILTLVKIADE